MNGIMFFFCAFIVVGCNKSFLFKLAALWMALLTSWVGYPPRIKSFNKFCAVTRNMSFVLHILRSRKA